MAEQYGPGKQKIYYNATSSKTGLTVAVRLCRSNNEACMEMIGLTESEHFPGVYSFLYSFMVGVYFAVFFENGVRTITQVYSI